MYATFEVGIHLPTLLMHNGQLADPLNHYVKQMRILTSKRNNKTEADLKQLADLEYVGSLYLNDKKQPILPSMVIEATIANGAKKVRQGPVCLASVYVDEDAVLDYEGAPMTVEELTNSEAHRLVCGVRVKGNRIIRTRPMFKDVSTSFKVSLNLEQANPDQLKEWITNSLNQVGFGDWRPRYGRGTLTSFGEVR